MNSRNEIKPSGVPLLDGMIGGGIPGGSVVCCLINPKSMAEVLLYQLASSGRTLYFTTERRPEHIIQNARELKFDTDKITFIDIYSKFNLEDGEKPSQPARKNLYELSYNNARNDARLFTESVKLPKDTLWKFEFWSKEKVKDVVGDLCNKIFIKLMKTSEKSSFSFTDVDPKNKRFSIEFTECPECVDIKGFKDGICYYHAGLFAGLLSSLLDSEMSAYEKKCCACGDDVCQFIIGPGTDPEIQKNVNKYLKPISVRKEDEIALYTEHCINQIQPGDNVIIDSFSFYVDIIHDKERLRRLLNHIYESVSRTGCVCYLSVFKDTHDKAIENMIVNKCDVVFDLDVGLDGDALRNTLIICKIRGTIAPNRCIKVHIRDRISLDTSQEVI